MIPHDEALRRAELERCRPWLPPGADVLELGGGSGLQASVMTSWGCRVTSIDLAGRPRSARQWHPVADYDGVHVPAQDASFDVVFSSNVLEHVKELPALLAETRRVLRPGGRAVHVVPSPAWRFWTSLAHYPYLVARALGRRRSLPGVAEAPTLSSVVARRGVLGFLGRVLLAGPHGEAGSAAAELLLWRRTAWRRRFEDAGFEVLHAEGSGLACTGYGLLPGLSLEARARLARVAGSACHVFVLARRAA